MHLKTFRIYFPAWPLYCLKEKSADSFVIELVFQIKIENIYLLWHMSKVILVANHTPTMEAKLSFAVKECVVYSSTKKPEKIQVHKILTFFTICVIEVVILGFFIRMYLPGFFWLMSCSLDCNLLPEKFNLFVNYSPNLDDSS